MRRKSGLTFTRIFAKTDKPYNEVKWTRRNIELKGAVETIFKQDNVEAPEEWSDRAVFIAASKYFRGHIGQPGRETSVKELVDRVTDTITTFGMKNGYFDKKHSKIFNAELKKLLIEQRLAFNSPVFFNVGIEEKPQGSACFVLSVEDDLNSIAELQLAETKLFSMGSGAGTNLSSLRPCNEPLSRGGWASGPLSFLRGYDGWAGIIRSGGVLRRASKMVRIDDWHPDVYNGKNDGSDFITFKAYEERKARGLFDQGFPTAIAYQTVSGQNCNLSVGVSDMFMNAVIGGKDWDLRWPQNNAKYARRMKASEMFDAIVSGIYECGDPGIQFDDTINSWNTCVKTGRIRGSNPCSPGWARVLTPDGIRTFDDIDVGSTIWSGTHWTKVIKKTATGQKPVFGFATRAGTFYGTKDHRIVQNGQKIRVDSAETIDIASFDATCSEAHDLSAQDIMDGLVFGDGMVHKASANLPPLLCVGKNDRDYFDSEVSHLFNKSREKLNQFAWSVTTTLSREECPRTYERRVPDRFLFGNPEKIRGFLRGLYSANGSVVSSRITLKASSRQAVGAIQAMLSALGIRSYYTVNKEHDVEFANGTFTCKESYDINISTDRIAFKDLINFIQKDKQKRLEAACKRSTNERKAKTSYEIVEIAPLGIMPVFDITVDAPEHTYWTDGLLVSNCGEFLPPGEGACNLLSLNLVKFFSTSDGLFFKQEFLAAVRIAVIAQDILVDLCSYPLPRIEASAKKYRPLGLGFANLGGLLMSMGWIYDSDQSRLLASSISALMTGQAYKTSIELANVKGPFPELDVNRRSMINVLRRHKNALDGLVVTESATLISEIYEEAADVWTDVIDKIQKYPLRNSQVTLIAPTGTIGLMMDCDTTGIEPHFLLVVNKSLVGGGSLKIISNSITPGLDALGYPQPEQARIVRYILDNGTVESSGIRDKDLPVFDMAYPIKEGGRCISASGHIGMVAAVQPFVSGGISKTIGQPETVTKEEIGSTIISAWKAGIKSLTIYRDGSKITAPISRDSKTAARVRYARERLPTTRKGEIHKFDIGGTEGYLQCGFFEDGRLGEIFITLAKEGSTMRGMMDCFATSISIALQSSVPLSVLIDKFRNVKFEPNGLTRNRDPNNPIPMCSSIIDYIFHYLTKYDPDSAEESVLTKHETLKAQTIDRRPSTAVIVSHNTCRSCGSLMVREGPNCESCPNKCPGSGSGVCGG
jgi:ribonucleoside-diphosphate reductase alpha chain